jgi:hypothetical protein
MMIHKFEDAKLGSAPFKCIGFWQMPDRGLLETYPEAWNAQIKSAPCPVGCCAYCGAPLSNHYIIKSADGRNFAVGSECVAKAGDKGLTDAAKLAKRRADRDARDKKDRENSQAVLWQQRQEYAGITGWEWYQRWERILNDRFAQEDAIRFADLIPIADYLRSKSGSFCYSVGDALSRGMLPRGNAWSIVLDIMGKSVGRSNSKAYAAEVERVEGIFSRYM